MAKKPAKGKGKTVDKAALKAADARRAARERDARRAARERDAQLLRDQQADLERIRRAAEIAPDAWWGRS